MVTTGKRPLETNLVLDLRFSEGLGALALDVSGNRNNGTIYNSPAWVSGGGITLDGIDQSIQVAQHASLESVSTISLEAILIPLFIETTNNFWDAIIQKSIVTTDGYCLLIGDDDVVFHSAFSTNTGWRNKAFDTQPVIGVEAHIVSVFSGDSIKNYYDGEPDGETNFGACTINYPNVVNLDIGKFGARYFETTVKLVRIYDVALSDEDVALLYAQRRRM